jgi:hypothetical protein
MPFREEETRRAYIREYMRARRAGELKGKKDGPATAAQQAEEIERLRAQLAAERQRSRELEAELAAQAKAKDGGPMYAAAPAAKPLLTGDAQVDRLKALWHSGRDKYASFYAELDRVRLQVGDEALANWTFDNLRIGMTRITEIANILTTDDANRVKEELKAAKAHARQQRRGK